MTGYKDEWCEHEMLRINLSDGSVVSTRKGVYCTVFGIDDDRFCARSGEEKELWLRAVSNIKVKLMFEAPDPTEDEIEIFRAAVREKLDTLELSGHDAETNPPLLVQADRMPDVTTVAGDSGLPEPIDDPEDYAPNERGDWVGFSDARVGAPVPVPEESIANNPTVYVTSKALISEASEFPDTKLPPTSPLGSNGNAHLVHGGVPLLAWSPGRRQAAQRAV
jgi:hypothetical protein